MDFVVTEPTTMLTDYVLGGLSLYLGWQLLRRAPQPRRLSMKLWGSAFLTTAVAAFAGGTSHGFGQELSTTVLQVLWKLTVYSIGLSGFFLLSAGTLAFVPPACGRWLLGAWAAKLSVYVLWMLTHDDFRYVIYDYGSALLILFGLQLGILLKGRAKSGYWLLAGIILSFGAGAIQQSGFGLHRHFNHNDLFHVVQMAALYFFYRAGLCFS